MMVARTAAGTWSMDILTSSPSSSSSLSCFIDLVLWSESFLFMELQAHRPVASAARSNHLDFIAVPFLVRVCCGTRRAGYGNLFESECEAMGVGIDDLHFVDRGRLGSEM